MFEKKAPMSESVKSFLVMGSDGKYNLDASVEKFRSFAIKTIGGREASVDLVTQCVGSLFDEHRGTRMNMRYITSQVAIKMIAADSSLKDTRLFPMLVKRVEDYMKENTGESKAFSANRGPGAGVVRMSDQPATAKIVAPIAPPEDNKPIPLNSIAVPKEPSEPAPEAEKVLPPIIA